MGIVALLAAGVALLLWLLHASFVHGGGDRDEDGGFGQLTYFWAAILSIFSWSTLLFGEIFDLVGGNA